jgi:hypothetical protein
MEDIVIQIEKIEVWFIKAYYEKAYEEFFEMCKAYPDFQDSAASIYTRFNDLCKDVEMGVVSLSEKAIRKQDIAHSYQMCMKRFKKQYLISCETNCIYEEEEYVLFQQRKRMTRTRIKMEEEREKTDDPKKISFLLKIVDEIKTILNQLSNLLKHFAEVRNYERVR